MARIADTLPTMSVAELLSESRRMSKLCLQLGIYFAPKEQRAITETRPGEYDDAVSLQRCNRDRDSIVRELRSRFTVITGGKTDAVELDAAA